VTQPEAIPAPAASAHPLGRYLERNERKIVIWAFIAGFVFDIFTFERVDSWFAIGQQTLYLVVITAALVQMLLEDGKPRSNLDQMFALKRWYYQYRTVIVHFFFGSLLNLYTIYFFKSSSLLVSSAFLAVLVLLLAANESKRFKSLGLAFKFALLSLCYLSFFAHVVPVFVGSIGVTVFLLSILVGCLPLLIVGWGIRAYAPDLFPQTRRQIVVPLGLVLIGFLAFYLFRLIPPVPLSLPFIGVYHGVERTGDNYELSHERPFWRFWHNGDQWFHAQPGDKVYVFFRVFSPTRFSDQVQVRWYWKDAARGWLLHDTIPINIIGGRERGFRGYGVKANYQSGRWKVQVETTDGREIGRIYFRLETAPTVPRSFVVNIE
jgi:DUF2914 family protein